MTKRKYDDATAELIDHLENCWEVAEEQGLTELAAELKAELLEARERMED